MGPEISSQGVPDSREQPLAEREILQCIGESTELHRLLMYIPSSRYCNRNPPLESIALSHLYQMIVSAFTVFRSWMYLVLRKYPVLGRSRTFAGCSPAAHAGLNSVATRFGWVTTGPLPLRDATIKRIHFANPEIDPCVGGNWVLYGFFPSAHPGGTVVCTRTVVYSVYKPWSPVQY